jgi:hypothetical protein
VKRAFNFVLRAGFHGIPPLGLQFTAGALARTKKSFPFYYLPLLPLMSYDKSISLQREMSIRHNRRMSRSKFNTGKQYQLPLWTDHAKM